MNRATIKKDRENQKRLLQELERLSDDGLTSEHHNLFVPSLHDTPLFSAAPFFSSSELADARDQSNHDNPLMVDLQNNSDASLMYEPVTPADVSESQQLHVDHNGTKVLQLPFSSAWLSTSELTDVGTSVSVSTSSSSAEKHPGLSPACVAAAATAAMIVVPDDHVIKRPRSPLREQPVVNNYNQEDSSTETSLEERNDPASPRSISGFPKETNTRTENQHRKEHHITVTRQRPLLTLPVQLMKSVQGPRKLPVDVEKRMVITLSLDASRDPVACRKRRAEAMERFRRKKAVRSFGRKVRYQIRKRIATTRPRVNGRFARRCDAESQVAKTSGNK